MEAIPQEMARCRGLMLRPPCRRRCRRRCRHLSRQRQWLTLLLPCAAPMRLLRRVSPAAQIAVQERLKTLKKEHGAAVLGQVTVEQVRCRLELRSV